MTVAEDRLNAFLGKAVGDMAASVSAVLMLIGDELGLYSALAGQRLSPRQLGDKTGTNERYVREWLANQAAGGYVEYDAENDQYYLNEEQALCLADPNGPVDLPGARSRYAYGGGDDRRSGAAQQGGLTDLLHSRDFFSFALFAECPVGPRSAQLPSASCHDNGHERRRR